jgi:hypothetical protein
VLVAHQKAVSGKLTIGVTAPFMRAQGPLVGLQGFIRAQARRIEVLDHFGAEEIASRIGDLPDR